MSSETSGSTRSDKPGSSNGLSLLYRRYTTSSALANVDVERTLAWTKAYIRDNFNPFLPSAKSAHILEIGCGYGRNLLALQDLGYTNTQGIDLSSEQVSYARDTLGLGQVQQADALEWLQQAKGGFDCILLIDVLEHLDLDTLMSLGELMYEKLAPGGSVIVQVPNDLSPFNPFRQGDLTHVRAFTSQSLQQFFTSVNLQMLGVHSALPIRAGVGLIRRVLWRVLFNPIFSLLFFLLHGRSMFTTVFTANVIAVAQKPAKGGLSQ